MFVRPTLFFSGWENKHEVTYLAVVETLCVVQASLASKRLKENLIVVLCTVLSFLKKCLNL